MIKFYLTLAKQLCKHNPIRTLIAAVLIILTFTLYKIPNSIKSKTFEESLHAVVVDKELNIIHDPNPNDICLSYVFL